MNEHWSIDRKIPLVFLLAVVVQTATLVWWASGVEQRIRENTADIRELRAKADAAECLKQDMAEVKNDIGWIKSWLEKYGR